MEIKAFINGKFINKTKTFDIISPTGTKFATAPSLDKEDIAFAFDSARKSQHEWELLTPEKRVWYLEKFAQILDSKKDEIAPMIVDEIAKPLKGAVKEITRTVELIRNVNQEYLKMYKSEMNFENLNKKVDIYRKALGVILAISPYNYPVNLSMSKIAPALVTGNTVVFKSATHGTGVAYQLAKIFDEIKLPKGVFNFVTGRGKNLGDSLYTNRHINGISFTGGEKVGMEISSASKMAIVILELGGKDIAIVRQDANIDQTATKIIQGAFGFNGQRCTAIKRLLVHKNIKKPLVDKIVELTNQLKVGPAIDNNDITPVISSHSADKIMHLVDDAIKKGAKPLTKIKQEDNLIHPIILDNVTTDMDIAWIEQFGPVLPIIEFESDQEAIDITNESRYGLQASIFTEDKKQAQHIAFHLDVGSVNINGPSQRGPDALPFTGTKHSGLNIQGVKYSLETMTRTFNIVDNYNK